MSEPSEQTTGAVLASEQDRKIRDSIENLLDEFAGVASTAIITDEIWNRIVGPALDARSSETQWGYRRRGEPDEFVRSASTEEVARDFVQFTGHSGDEWVAVQRTAPGPWIEVTS